MDDRFLVRRQSVRGERTVIVVTDRQTGQEVDFAAHDVDGPFVWMNAQEKKFPNSEVVHDSGVR